MQLKNTITLTMTFYLSILRAALLYSYSDRTSIFWQYCAFTPQLFTAELQLQLL